jgi:hypothetical protein
MSARTVRLLVAVLAVDGVVGLLLGLGLLALAGRQANPSASGVVGLVGLLITGLAVVAFRAALAVRRDRRPGRRTGRGVAVAAAVLALLAAILVPMGVLGVVVAVVLAGANTALFFALRPVGVSGG